MRVLGIDPGLNATGWAVLDRLRGRNRLVASGVVRTSSKAPMAQRLGSIHAGVSAVIAQHQPEGAAIEQVFQHRSAESALRLGHARGVALVALHQGGLSVGEYNPSTIKKSVAGNGRAGKPEIQRLVAALLGLEKPLPQDASDAAAIALTHLARAGLQARLDALAAAGGRA
ncbi:MAG: crossover junction endodeoxyribonuclease RuvC [Deltaproteobacteria bacterium]|nr:crossover junction endodeoxyribonuclease RuvC [Deltaproteobacteria bacterium]HCH65242.1 crossover junction endodeoxyribonuclease RuvC [Deltaproteobacteria bacterium]